jgi:hypothetical protein
MELVIGMDSLKVRIRRRLEKYLELDIDGIRKFIVNILLRLKRVTADQLYNELRQRFNISYSAVISTLGYIQSKLGILHAYKESYKTPIVYSLKEEYMDMVENALSKSAQFRLQVY